MRSIGIGPLFILLLRTKSSVNVLINFLRMAIVAYLLSVDFMMDKIRSFDDFGRFFGSSFSRSIF